VELKSGERPDLQGPHRARDRLVGERTALINHLRAFLLERGIVVPKGCGVLERRLEEVLAAEQPALSPRTRLPIEDMREEWRELDRRILAFDDEFAARARADEAARLLMTIPGIGPLNATALVAAVGRAEAFGRRGVSPMRSRACATSPGSAMREPFPGCWRSWCPARRGG
jgi:transposase